MSTQNFKDLFFEAFLSFQRKTGKHSITAFAQYLSKNKLKIIFSQQLVSGWLNGDFKPSEKYAPPLAEILGDEIYDILEFNRPDPDLTYLQAHWLNLSSQERRKMRESAENYIAKRKTDK